MSRDWIGKQVRGAMPVPSIGESSVESERNRSGSLERPRHSMKIPRAGEGRDGDQRYVEIGADTWVYFRINGKWKRSKAENG